MPLSVSPQQANVLPDGADCARMRDVMWSSVDGKVIGMQSQLNSPWPWCVAVLKQRPT